MLRLSKTARFALGAFVIAVLGFIYVPLLLVVANSFSSARISAWPIPGFSLDWWIKAAGETSLHTAILNSIITATGVSCLPNFAPIPAGSAKPSVPKPTG